MQTLSIAIRRAAAVTAAALTLLAAVGAMGAVPAQASTHYCSGFVNGLNACEYFARDYVEYNEVDADHDAVCEALSNYSTPPHPTMGILYVPEDCIGSGGSTAGTHYSASLPALYPWVGNRHTFQVQVYTATHYNPLI
jgi:hypothetical protein